MKNKYLLGATKDRELVFGEFQITHRNGYPEFTASFNTVRPFKRDDSENLEDYITNLLDECYDDEAKYKLCEQYDCTPSELPSNFVNDYNNNFDENDPRTWLDCSLYPETYNIDDEDWYFESSGGGQYDTRDEMDEYVDKRMYDLLHSLWDKYHLKDIDKYGEKSNVIESVEALDSALSKCNEEEWITNYIRRNF